MTEHTDEPAVKKRAYARSKRYDVVRERKAREKIEYARKRKWRLSMYRRYSFTLRTVNGTIKMHTNDIQQIYYFLSFRTRMSIRGYRLQYNGVQMQWPNFVWEDNATHDEQDLGWLRQWMLDFSKEYRRPRWHTDLYTVMDPSTKKKKYVTDDRVNLAMFLMGRPGCSFRLYIHDVYYPLPAKQSVDAMRILAIADAGLRGIKKMRRMNHKRYTYWNDCINRAVSKLNIESDIVDYDEELSKEVPALRQRGPLQDGGER